MCCDYRTLTYCLFYALKREKRSSVQRHAVSRRRAGALTFYIPSPEFRESVLPREESRWEGVACIEWDGTCLIRILAQWAPQSSVAQYVVRNGHCAHRSIDSPWLRSLVTLSSSVSPSQVKDRQAEYVLELILDNTKTNELLGWDVLSPFQNLVTLSLNGCGLVNLEGFPPLPNLSKVSGSAVDGPRDCCWCR